MVIVLGLQPDGSTLFRWPVFVVFSFQGFHVAVVLLAAGVQLVRGRPAAAGY